MKLNSPKALNIATLSFVLSLVLLALTMPSNNVCDAFDVYASITPDVIKFYETEIANQKVLSHKSQTQIEQIAKMLDVSPNKAKGLILLQDLSTRTGNAVSLKDLAKMNDMALITFAKSRIETYLSSQTPERKQYLISTLKSLVKK